MNKLIRPSVTASAPTRRGFMVGATSLTALVLAGCGSGADTKASTLKPATAKIDGDLNLFTYADYVPPAVIKGFEKEYGVKVTYTSHSTVDEMLKKLGAGLPYDLTMVASNYMGQAVDGGLLRPIDHDAIDNYDQVLPQFHVPPYDPDKSVNEKVAKYVGAPYAASALGLTWRTDQVPNMTGSFSDLWNNAAAIKPHTWMFDEARTSLAAALAYLGYSVNSSDAGELEEAGDALLDIKPDLGGFTQITTKDYMVDGRAWMLMAYSGDTYRALLEVDDPATLRYAVSKESALFNADNAVIPVAAKHPGTATLFIDWLLRPENMRQVVDFTGYVVPTTAGVAAYNKVVADYPWLNAQVDLMGDSEQWMSGLDQEALRTWNRVWTKVKAA